MRVDRIALADGGRAVRLRVTCTRTEPNRCTGFVALAARARGKNLELGAEGFFASLPAGA